MAADRRSPSAIAYRQQSLDDTEVGRNAARGVESTVPVTPDSKAVPDA